MAAGVTFAFCAVYPMTLVMCPTTFAPNPVTFALNPVTSTVHPFILTSAKAIRIRNRLRAVTVAVQPSHLDKLQQLVTTTVIPKARTMITSVTIRAIVLPSATFVLINTGLILQENVSLILNQLLTILIPSLAVPLLLLLHIIIRP